MMKGSDATPPPGRDESALRLLSRRTCHRGARQRNHLGRDTCREAEGVRQNTHDDGREAGEERRGGKGGASARLAEKGSGPLASVADKGSCRFAAAVRSGFVGGREGLIL